MIIKKASIPQGPLSTMMIYLYEGEGMMRFIKEKHKASRNLSRAGWMTRTCVRGRGPSRVMHRVKCNAGQQQHIN